MKKAALKYEYKTVPQKVKNKRAKYIEKKKEIHKAKKCNSCAGV